MELGRRWWFVRPLGPFFFAVIYSTLSHKLLGLADPSGDGTPPCIGIFRAKAVGGMHP